MIIKIMKVNDNSWLHKLPKNTTGLSFPEYWEFLNKLCISKHGCCLHSKYRELAPGYPFIVLVNKITIRDWNSVERDWGDHIKIIEL